MWEYDFVTREEFEKVKDKVEDFIIMLGGKVFSVLEVGNYEELVKNIMEDADPFPYDLTDNELLNEVKYSLGIEPYTKV